MEKNKPGKLLLKKWEIIFSNKEETCHIAGLFCVMLKINAGSIDLTQLTLGKDRDSALFSYLFNEENSALKGLIEETIRVAKRNGIRAMQSSAKSHSCFCQFLGRRRHR